MKKIYTLVALCFGIMTFGQTFPINFETATTWTDFDGGNMTTIANPFTTGNPSANVGKMVKSPGQVWGGSFLMMASNIDFATNNTITLKVYATKPNAKILVKVENEINGAIGYEVEKTMTMTNAWETISFDFSGVNTANTYKKVVIIGDLGTAGDGTANFTYYFDDITLSYVTPTVPPTSFPVGFETATTWTDFDGGNMTTVANPFPTGNSSANVGKMIKNAGQTWGGSFTLTNGAINFTSNNTISMKVYSIKPNTTVLCKVENSANAATYLEVSKTMTTTNAWETLTFDFSGINTSNSYNKLVLIFDLGTMGDGTANFTYYIDDITLSQSGGGMAQMNLPVNFEGTTTNYAVTDFGGNASVHMTDPNNAANKVIQTTKTAGAETWAGTTIGTNAGFSSAIPLASGNTKMNVKVYSPLAGIQVRLKVEDAANNTHSVETEATVTTANAWQTLEFNFANQASGTAAINFGYTYNKASIFFNFGVQPAANQVYMFDDVQFGAAPLSVNDFEANQSKIVLYPVPATNVLNIQTIFNLKNVTIYDVMGAKHTATISNNTIDVSNLPSGVYFASFEVENHEIITKKFIK